MCDEQTDAYKTDVKFTLYATLCDPLQAYIQDYSLYDFSFRILAEGDVIVHNITGKKEKATCALTM